MYRKSKAFIFFLTKNICYSVSIEFMKGDKFNPYEAGFVGYHSKWLGDGCRYENENEFIKDTFSATKSEFEKAYQLAFMRMGFASDNVQFVYNQTNKHNENN